MSKTRRCEGATADRDGLCRACFSKDGESCRQPESPKSPRCDLCKFWGNEDATVGFDDEGLCRRYPPTFARQNDDGIVIAFFVPTSCWDWCGEFVPMDVDEPILHMVKSYNIGAGKALLDGEDPPT